MGMKNIELGDDLHTRDPFRNSFFVTDVAATWDRETLADSLQVYFSMCTKIHLSTELDLDILEIHGIYFSAKKHKDEFYIGTKFS